MKPCSRLTQPPVLSWQQRQTRCGYCRRYSLQDAHLQSHVRCPSSDAPSVPACSPHTGSNSCCQYQQRVFCFSSLLHVMAAWFYVLPAPHSAPRHAVSPLSASPSVSQHQALYSSREPAVSVLHPHSPSHAPIRSFYQTGQ